MTRQELKRKLKTVLRDVDIPVRQEHIELTKSLASKELYSVAVRERIGFARFLSMQIRFIGWKIWAMQGVVLVMIRCLLTGSIGRDFIENPRYAALLLCCLSVLILMSALPFIHRSIRYKMHETEAATRFSSVRLLMAKLLIVGIGDVLMLICILCVAVFKTPLSAGDAALYLLFPFLLAGSGLLFLISHIPAARFVVGGIGLGVFLLAAFSLLSGVLPAFYQQTFSVGWAAVCLALVAVSIFQVKQLIRCRSYAEMQL